MLSVQQQANKPDEEEGIKKDEEEDLLEKRGQRLLSGVLLRIKDWKRE